MIFVIIHHLQHSMTNYLGLLRKDSDIYIPDSKIEIKHQLTYLSYYLPPPNILDLAAEGLPNGFIVFKLFLESVTIKLSRTTGTFSIWLR